MGRAPRIEFPGAYYHIISRGNEKRSIFYDDLDRKKFLILLKEYASLYKVVFFCYALMDNHYHLGLQTPLGNLVKFMHGLNTAYSIYFNTRHNRVGHLFQGRYKAILVEKDNYLLELTRYVHLNPVRAGICSKPEEYPWSSYPGYIRSGVIHSWINYKEIYQFFSDDKSRALTMFSEFTNSRLSKTSVELYEKSKKTLFLGDASFIENIMDISEESNALACSAEQIDIETLLQAVAEHFHVPTDNILAKGSRYNSARQIAVYLLKQYCFLSNDQIALLFGGVHYSSVSKVYSRMEAKLQHNPELYKEIESLLSRCRT